METFHKMIDAIGRGVPSWVPLIVLPALLALVAVIFTLFGGRKLYRYFAAVIGGAGFFLVTCIDELRSAFIFLGLYVVLAAALRLLFLIPCPLRNRKKESKEREEKIYKKFHESLSEQQTTVGGEIKALPLPNAYVYRQQVTAEDYGAHVGHAVELLAQLKRLELAPTDRLEVDALSRTVSALRGKPLTEEEMGVLNDCLASTLKLTAKYKL